MQWGVSVIVPFSSTHIVIYSMTSDVGIYKPVQIDPSIQTKHIKAPSP